MRFFRVRNFEKFQHYKDRNPPWIKLYRSILDDPRFFQLTEVDRFLLLGIFILASQNENKLPADQSWLKTKLLTRKMVPIDLLVASEWLEWLEQPASTGASKQASNPASTADSNAASKSASTFASVRALAREETEKRQRQKTEAEESPFPQIAQTQKVSRPKEGNGRAVENQSPQALKAVFSPIEAHLRKNIEPNSFLAYYEGIRVERFTASEVFLAVPGTLIHKRFSGDTAQLAKALTHTFDSVDRNFMRGRILRILDLDEVSPDPSELTA